MEHDITTPGKSAEALDDLLDELEGLLETDPESFVAAYVQQAGNGGTQYWALLDALLDRHGPDALIQLAAEFAAEPHDTYFRNERIRVTLGESIASAIRGVIDPDEFREILQAFTADLSSEGPGPQVNDLEATVRACLRRDNVSQARLIARADQEMGSHPELGLFLDETIPEDDPELELILRLWQLTAAANDDCELTATQARVPDAPVATSELAWPEQPGDADHPNPPHAEQETVSGLDDFSESHARGRALEDAMINLLGRFFSLDSNWTAQALTRLRKQSAGTQFGHDLSFTATSQRFGTSRCHFECKHYRSPIRTADVAAKVVQQEFYYRDEPIDHWILVSPHASASNELRLLVDSWNTERRFPFTVQLWTPDENVAELFSMNDAVYSAIYGLDPPMVDQVDQARILESWSDKLRPLARIPTTLERYLHAPARMCLPGEPAAEFAVLAEDHVVPRVTDETGTPLRGSCEQHVREWLQRRDEPTLLLTGEFGDGKSFLTYLLTRRLAQEFLNEPASGWFAIRLSLRLLRSAGSARRLLENRLDEVGSSIGDWEELRSTTPTLVILDGLDEMSTELDPATVTENLALLEECAHQFEGSKVLITTRSGFLERRRDAERLGDRLRHPRRLTLSPVSRLRRVQHLNQYADRLGLRERMERLRRLYDPIGLAGKPLFLQMIKVTLESLPEDHFDEVTLYRTYVDLSLSRKIELLRDPEMEILDSELKENLAQVLESIAWRIHRSDNDYVNLAELREEFPQGIAGLLWRMGASEGSVGEESDAEARVGVRSLLRPATGDQSLWPVSFFHRSMQEYFCASHIVRSIKRGIAAAQAVLWESTFGAEIGQFAIAILRSEDTTADLVATLTAIARSSLIELPGAGGGGALSLLYGLTGDVPGTEWGGLRLDGCSLPSVDLSDKSFAGSSLRAAILDNATLDRADLSGADLTGVRIEDTAAVAALCVAGGALVVVYDDGTIRSWRRMGNGGQWFSTIVAQRSTSNRAWIVTVTEANRVIVVGRFLEIWEMDNADGSGRLVTRFRVRSDVVGMSIAPGGTVVILHESEHGTVDGLMVDLSSLMASNVGTEPSDAAIAAHDDWLVALPSSAGRLSIVFSDGAQETLVIGSDEPSCVAIGSAAGMHTLVVGTVRGTVLMSVLAPQSGTPLIPPLIEARSEHHGVVTGVAVGHGLVASGGLDGMVCVVQGEELLLDGMAPWQKLNLEIACAGLKFEGVVGEVEQAMLQRLVS